MKIENIVVLVVGIVATIMLVVYITRDREGVTKKVYKEVTNTESDVERATVSGVNKTVNGAENAYDSAKRAVK